MEIKDEDVPFKLLCTACLCVGRKLHTLKDEKTQNYYLSVLGEIPLFPVSSVTPRPQVCWECKALLEKSVNFKEQVQNSYRILQTYTKENLHECLLTDVSRSPRLIIGRTEAVSISPDDDDHVDSVPEVPIVCIKNEMKDDSDFDKDDTNVLEDTSPLSDCSENTKNFESELQNIMCSMKRDDKRKRVSKKVKKAKKLVLSNVKREKSKSEQNDQKILTIDMSYEEMLSERDREATREAFVKSHYKCESCLIGFNYKKSYLAHVANKHSPELGEYTCPVCKTILPSVDSFTAHYKRHLRRYECGICHKRTLDMKVMQQHYYSTHEISLKEYKCNLCGKISNSIDTHRYHKDTHKARIQCTECDKTFRHRAGLMNHRLAVHEYHNAFPCTICDKQFRWKNSLKRHLEKHEAKAKTSSSSAYCSACNVSFSSTCSYQRHMRNSLRHVSHDQLKFICDHCNKRFADKTKLRDHIEEKHLHRTYQCHICMKPSKNRVGLDQHIRNVHKGRPNNKMCHHCGKGFPTKVQLESHIRTHTGERPFICEFCPTTFSQQSNLYKHNRQVHLNIKSKRYPLCKRKEDKPLDVPILDHTQPIDPYRPVAMLHYSAEKGFVI
nr:zinc finger protein 483-like [Helicoverpa armigera]